ncbi:MAG: type transport system permease protein [Frankiaceae bacterium]|jgi:ABC-2 type transport system permease protein|nr:type transport system permease protein [Frankiaceae bacterium]
MTALDLTPAPGAAPIGRRIARHASMELRLLLRNGEQLLLTIVIPTVLLVVLVHAPLADIPRPRSAFLVPGVLALAVMSTAFTGQAIATGFERRYGVLRRLGATPLGRGGLLAGKTLAVIGVEVLQVALLVAVGLAVGWHPHGSALAALALVLLGTVAFSALGLLMAGTLRAEATLAGANLVYLLLLVVSGIAFPLTDFSASVRHWLQLLPSAALADGLRAALGHGAAVPGRAWIVLAVWAVAAAAAAMRWFRWG